MHYYPLNDLLNYSSSRTSLCSIPSKLYLVCMILLLTTILSACGAKGDLVLPENIPAAITDSSVSTISNGDEANKQKQRTSSDAVPEKE